ncbi:MAG: response regulator [Cyanobacteriota bacterium]
MNKRKTTILLVDDDYDYLIQQKSLLEEQGFNIITSEGGKNIRIIMDNSEIDVAIVDLMMDDMDSGFILSYEMKKKYPSLPIIMVTGVTNKTGLEFDSITDSEKQWIKADSIFTKPVRIDQLVREIKRLLKDDA